MMRLVPIFKPTQFFTETAKWLEVIRRKEHLVVTFFPEADRLRRLNQLLDDEQYIKEIVGDKTWFLLFDIDSGIIEDEVDFVQSLVKILNFTFPQVAQSTLDDWITYLTRNDLQIVIIFPSAEKYISPEGLHILDITTNFIIKHLPYFTVFAIYNRNITHPNIVTNIAANPTLFQNIFTYPLYNADDTYIFLRFLEKRFNVKISNRMKKDIIERCGGHTWIVREAVRRIEINSGWSWDNETVLFKLTTIFNSLLPSERSALEKLVTKKQNYTPEEQVSLEYFQQMRFIDSSYRLLMGVYQDYVLLKAGSIHGLTFEESRLVFNHVPLENFFSRKEYRVMKALMEKKGEVVTRDEIARRIWPTDTDKYYSDWAIDQIIARIRKRMVELTLPPEILKVVRGKGYQLKISK